MYTPDKERYNKMPYRRCGNSGLMLPAVSLGLWHNFGADAPKERSRDMLLAAFDAGITHFDLANNYGLPVGSAEETLGKVLKSDLMPYRDELIISSKAGYRMWEGPYGEWGSRKNLIASCDQSLKRMGLDYVDIFYHHRPDPDTPLEETCAALEQIVRSGKALYVGISNYDAEKTALAYDLMAERGIRLLVHQPSYSMLNRWVEGGLLKTLEEKGMGSVVFSPLAQGRLTSRYFNGIPEDSRIKTDGRFLKSEHITEDLLRITRRLNEVAESRGQTLAQMALAWVLRQRTVTSVIIGASSVAQILENAATVNKLTFTQEELKLIDEILISR